MYYVYCHTNKRNKKRYIGVTNDPKRRWRCGGVEYKPSKGEIKNRLFYNAILKNGFDAFEHQILEEFATGEEAFDAEKRYIQEFKTQDKKFGYNVSPGGNGGKVYKQHPRNMLGKPQTKYQIEHQIAYMSDESNNPMLNGAVCWGKTHPHPRGFFGKKHSDDEISKIRQTLLANSPRRKPLIVTYPNGNEEEYRSMKDAEKGIGLTKPVILKIIRSGCPYKIKVRNGDTDRIAHLEGIAVAWKMIPR